jgi:hypothetical protein
LVHSITPTISKLVPSGSTLRGVLSPLVNTFVGNNVTSQGFGADLEIDLDTRTDINQDVLLMSSANEIAKIAGAPSSKLVFQLSSTNPNVSPIIDVSTLSAMCASNSINNQAGEDKIIVNTELTPGSGTASARYITKTNTLSNISSSAKVFVTAYSSANTSVDVYIRTSLSSKSLVHTDQSWVLLDCDIARNKSSTKDQFFEYDFYKNTLPPFDIFDLKIVMTSTVRHDAPIISDYRAVVTA